MTVKEAEKPNYLDNIEINYSPATVEFNDFESFEKGIEIAVAQYSAFDLEVNTIEEVKQARTELNALSKKLEDKRKEIKQGINNPYTEFEKQYKGPYSKLTGLISELKKQIDDYEENQKALRKDKVRAYFHEKAEEADLNKQVFDQYLDDFLKASDFTSTFNFKKAAQEKLDNIIIQEIDKQNQRDADMMAITDLCAKNNLGPASYIRQYDNGATLAEILGLINRDVDEIERQRKELEAKRLADEQAQAQRQKEIEEQATIEAKEKIVAVDQETGEILEEAVEVAKYTTTIEFVFDMNQAKEFKNFLEDKGIEFKTIKGMEKVNETLR